MKCRTMELDPKAKALLTAIAVAGPPDIRSVPLEFAREMVEQGYARMRIPVIAVGSVKTTSFVGPGGDVAVRIYNPAGEGPFPVIVFFHGGGWVFFRLDAYDPICTHLCSFSRCVVVSVDYRLSPENRFPAATDDCLAATRWVAEHCCEWSGDPCRIFVAGDSAGGNLATVTAIRIRDEFAATAHGPSLHLAGQVLIYPVTDYCIPEKPSYCEFADGFGLTKGDMQWFWDKYLGKAEDAANFYVAPLLAADLSGLPPAMVIISGYDPLRDEGLAYANRLEEAGVPVKLSVYEDMIHGFLSYLGIMKQAKTAIEEISVWVKEKAK